MNKAKIKRNAVTGCVLVACGGHIVAYGIQQTTNDKWFLHDRKRRGKQRQKTHANRIFVPLTIIMNGENGRCDRCRWHFVLLGILTHIQDRLHLSNDHRCHMGMFGPKRMAPLSATLFSLARIHFKIAFLSIKFRFPFYAHDSRWSGWFSARNSSHTLCVCVWFLWYLIPPAPPTVGKNEFRAGRRSRESVRCLVRQKELRQR